VPAGRTSVWSPLRRAETTEEARSCTAPCRRVEVPDCSIVLLPSTHSALLRARARRGEQQLAAAGEQRQSGALPAVPEDAVGLGRVECGLDVGAAHTGELVEDLVFGLHDTISLRCSEYLHLPIYPYRTNNANLPKYNFRNMFNH